MTSLFNVVAMFLRVGTAGLAAAVHVARKEGTVLVPFAKEALAAFEQSELPAAIAAYDAWDASQSTPPSWAVELKALFPSSEEDEGEDEDLTADGSFLLRDGNYVQVMRNPSGRLDSLIFTTPLSHGLDRTAQALSRTDNSEWFNSAMTALRTKAPKGHVEQTLLNELEREHTKFWARGSKR